MSGPSIRQVFFVGKIFVHVFSLPCNQIGRKDLILVGVSRQAFVGSFHKLLKIHSQYIMLDLFPRSFACFMK